TVLGWLGLTDIARQTDRLLALDTVLRRHHAKVKAATEPLPYLRAVVKHEERRIQRDKEDGGRGWKRIELPAPARDSADEEGHPKEEVHPREEVHPEERHIRAEDAFREARERDAGRSRPALARLLRGADSLRRDGAISDAEDRLLKVLESGIP